MWRTTTVPIELAEGCVFDGHRRQLRRTPLSDSDLMTFVGIIRSDLPRVERLSIRRTQITDIRPLTEMKQLTWLDISGTCVRTCCR